jgi:glycosyltransferase involved in cell wall biosynthesis
VVLVEEGAAAVPLSVVILTLNEQENLPYALQSVRDWAQEIIVLDSGSTDATVTIAESFGARVVFHAFEDYSKQRNYALRELDVRTEWLLFLDADEWAPPALRTEISSLLASRPNANGFFVTFRLVWMGTPIRFGYRPSWLLRLVRPEFAGCDDRGFNEHLTVSGEAGYLRAALFHEERRGVSRWIEKHDRYAALEAALLFNSASTTRHDKGRLLGTRAQRTRWIRDRVWRHIPALLRPWLYFFVRFVMLGGFLDGRTGFAFHFLHALWYQTLIDIKLLEMRAALRPGDTVQLARSSAGAGDTQPRGPEISTTHVSRISGKERD